MFLAMTNDVNRLEFRQEFDTDFVIGLILDQKSKAYYYEDVANSIWDVANGLVMDGPWPGESLQPAPSSSAYDWAWLDFYPETEFYER